MGYLSVLAGSTLALGTAGQGTQVCAWLHRRGTLTAMQPLTVSIQCNQVMVLIPPDVATGYYDVILEAAGRRTATPLWLRPLASIPGVPVPPEAAPTSPVLAAARKAHMVYEDADGFILELTP